jgi:hypothetical protein
VDCIHLYNYGEQWKVYENTVMNLTVKTCTVLDEDENYINIYIYVCVIGLRAANRIYSCSDNE